MIDADSLLTRFPLFNGISEDVINAVIAQSEIKFDADIWTNELIREQAILLQTAHDLALEYWESLDLAQSYAGAREGKNNKPQKHTDYYGLTRYGIELKQLLRHQSLGIL